MKSKLALIGSLCTFALLVIGADYLTIHLMLPADRINETLTPAIYRALILKWFAGGVAIGMGTMFFFIETWMWRNWKSWNKHCCDWHEKVYRSEMGLTQGRMLRR